MKRILIPVLTLLVILMSIPIYPHYSFASTKTSSYHIPVSSTNPDPNVLASALSYTFDIPFPLDATDVDINSVTFTGHGSIIPSLTTKDITNRKITVTINGEAQTQNSLDVYGYKDDTQTRFESKPGDNEWLYSSGLRWQLNSLDRYCVTSGGDINTTCQTTENYLTSSPTTDPPIRTLTTVSVPSLTGNNVIWFTADNRQLRSGVQVDTSTITLSDENHSGIQGPDIGSDDYAFNVHQYFGTTIIGDQSVPSTGNSYFPDTSLAPSGWTPVGYAKYSKDYEVKFYYAFHAKTLPSTTYNYNGDVTFSYTSSPDPYVGISADASPSDKCDDGTDTTVTIPANGTLFNVTDQNSVAYWNFYAKVDGDDSTLQQNLNVSANSTNGGSTFTFTIPESSVTTDPYSVKYKVTAIAVMAQTDASLTPYTYQATTYTTTTINKTLCAQKIPAIIVPTLTPPIVNVTAPNKVRAGDDAYISAVWTATNPGGSITHAYWYTGGNSTIADLQHNGTVWYPTEGQYSVSNTVIDNYYMSGFDYRFITVTPPEIHPYINYTGTLKENRKVTLNVTADTPTHYPMDISKTVWQITPFSGGALASSIKYVGSLNGVNSLDTLFKTAGVYQVTVTVTNTAGYSASTSTLINIVPDLPPVTDYHIVSQEVQRDPKNGNLAPIELWDDSYSPDGDIITQRIWKYAYDSNNDGNFNDETWIVIDSTNLTHITLFVNPVGKYKFELQTVESFGQPTIAQFIVPADYRTSNTWQ